MQRRTFLKGMVAAPLLTTKSLPFNLLLKGGATVDKVLVLGMDGMEISLLKRFVSEGHMPTFKKFMEGAGYAGPLKTTLPALSPVAWSSFITGTNPGKHGVFDFVSRDPKTLAPYLSTAVSKPSSSVGIGNFQFPIGGGTEQTRQGKALWDYLAERGMSHSFFRLPGNYPCEGAGEGKSISGMGTPDLTGAYGTATLLIEGDSSPLGNKSGSRIITQRAKDFSFSVELEGPPDPFSKEHKGTVVKVEILKDPIKEAIKITAGEKSIILEVGKWSEWIPVHFGFMGGMSGADGMFQCYIKSVHPKLEIYFSPVLIDPLANSIPTSYPASYSAELAEKIGRFNTLGLPADTKSLSNGLLNDEEYLQQARGVLNENFKAFDYELSRFSEGLMFFYFSSLDQNQHMLWRCFDENHPQYDPSASPTMKTAVRDLYIEMDKALHQALSRVDSRTLVMVLSDHGFMPFNREFELNSWLRDQGYLVLNEKARKKETEELSIFTDVDWDKTKAYGVGFSGLFLNIKGREQTGIVEPHKCSDLLKEIRTKIRSTIDQATNKVVGRAVIATDEYNGEAMAASPDILMAYSPEVRVSDNSVLGGFSKTIFGPRTNKWSADHCMEPAKVPGILISSHALNTEDPAIWDLVPTILAALGMDTYGSSFDGKALIS